MVGRATGSAPVSVAEARVTLCLVNLDYAGRKTHNVNNDTRKAAHAVRSVDQT